MVELESAPARVAGCSAITVEASPSLSSTRLTSPARMNSSTRTSTYPLKRVVRGYASQKGPVAPVSKDDWVYEHFTNPRLRVCLDVTTSDGARPRYLLKIFEEPEADSFGQLSQSTTSRIRVRPPGCPLATVPLTGDVGRTRSDSLCLHLFRGPHQIRSKRRPISYQVHSADGQRDVKQGASLV